MGSFLQTCCITNQSIQEGEEVYIIPLIENVVPLKVEDEVHLGLNRLCYNTDMFMPMGFIFTGEYADYGRYDVDFSDASNKLMMNSFIEVLQKEALDVPLGENKYHDVPFNPSSLDSENLNQIWDHIHEAIWEGRLFVTHPYRSLTQFGFKKGLHSKVHYFIVSKPNTDILLDMYDNQPLSNYYYSAEYEAYAKMNKKERAEDFIKILKDLSKPDPDGYNFSTLWNFNDRSPHKGMTSTSVYKSWSLTPFIKMYKDGLEESSIISLYESHVKLRDLTTAMTHCHLVFRPVHYGTQDYGNDIGNRFSYFMSLVLNHNIKNMLESEDFYFEDDEDGNETPVTTFSIKKHIEKISKSFR